MSGTKSFLSEDLSSFFEIAWLELPAEAAKVLLGAADEKGLRKVGWKAYDAWLNLANEMINGAYSDPVLGEASGRLMEMVLRLRQIGGTMAATFFGNLWPAIGLPTHSEIVALRDELLMLRQEIAANNAKVSIADESIGVDAPETLGTEWKRAHLNGYRGANGNVIRRPSNQGKRNVAA